MNEKLNLAEILKDCPKGMELDCTIYDDVEFMNVDTSGDIILRVRNKFIRRLNKYGKEDNIDCAKCVIFPKGKNTWEGFVPPCDFKDADVIYVKTRRSEWVSIFNNESETQIFTYTDYNLGENKFYGAACKGIALCHKHATLEKRIATEEEKEKLFQAIKDNGYKWNAETKTLEEEKKDKFDPATLKPFDQVLVRDALTDKWRIGFFEKIDTANPKYDTTYSSFHHCIPYNDETKHLLGKAGMEPEYYQVDEYLL